ncbi:MAG TPA: tryptophan synthase subunit alpha [Candidatus Dormibacteraeota bacterium]|nr:tryptophan synthase subunit alpha [Candidatus Dormibacteraeota bacterium]
MSKAIMCHVVAGFPDEKASLQMLVGLSRSGVSAIEVQIPFSDPIADGETIMRANDVALELGMTTAGSFKLIKQARSKGVDTDIYIMSYLQKVRHFGMADFCLQAADCGVKGLIIPDLPYDSLEFDSLRELTGEHAIELVPVLSPGMPEYRLKTLLAYNPTSVYVTSQRGITGNKYTPAEQLKQLVATIRQQSKARVMIGFGIASSSDVDNALSIGDIAVVGSAVVQAIQSSGIKDALVHVKTLVTG